MSHRQNPFLDLEAETEGVDRREDDDDDDDDDDIQDFFNEDEADNQSPPEEYQSWDALETFDHGKDDEIESFLSLLNRHRDCGIEPCTSTGSANQLQEMGETASPFPLYRVRCRPGMEENALAFLLQKSSSEHIASAFLRESICGWIYIETRVDEPVIRLLSRTPGVCMTQQGPILEGIEQPDWSKLLTMTNHQCNAVKGQWVLVKHGLYKGDIALVAQVQAWGIQVLIIPRLSPPPSPDDSDQGSQDTRIKRKKVRIIPDAELFNPVEFHQRYKKLLSKNEHKNHFQAGSWSFEHGLLCKDYTLHGISPIIAPIPSKLFFTFLNSRHPLVISHQDRLPRPLEWCVSAGMRVENLNTHQYGEVKLVDLTHVNVELEDGSGEVSWSWYPVRQYVRIGDYVEVMSGVAFGKKGWIISIEADIVQIVDIPNTHMDRQANTAGIESHVNRVRKIQVPFLPLPVAPPQSSGKIMKDYIPWLGTCVVITQSAWKGRHGTVENTIWPQAAQGSSAGLRLIVRLEEHNPNHPFNQITLGYDDVREASSKMKLIEYARSKGLHVPSSLAYPLMAAEKLPDGWTTGAPGTPMPSSSSTPLTPAWDPNSRTPIGDDVSVSASTSAHTIRRETPTHPLLQHLFIGTRLRVNVHGGGIPGSEMTVWVDTQEDEQLGFRCVRKKVSGWLQPSWVEARRPNPNRGDNGLMVVVHGPHCGKFVRRITHRQGENDTVCMLCAVVLHKEGVADVLTQEELVLGIHEVCLAWETKEDKGANKTLVATMNSRGRTVKF